MLYFIEMKVTITGESEMKAFGERIGRCFKGGECVELIGDIGAGKTTLTKGMAAGLKITETVQSPTFTINRTYDSPTGLRLSHYDFYRLSDAGIMADELAESLEDSHTVIAIEWGAVVNPVLPVDTLRITIESPDEFTRTLTLRSSGAVSQRIVEALV